LSYNNPWFTWRQWLGGSSFSKKNSNLLSYIFETESNLGFVGSQLEVPPASPFSGIGWGQPFLTVRCDRLSLRVRAPEVMGQEAVEVVV
jgi:hypothetical protein